MAVVKEELETARKLVVLLEGKPVRESPFFEKRRGRNKESIMSQSKQLPNKRQAPKQPNIDLHVNLLGANRKARNNEEMLTIANERIWVLNKTVEEQKNEIENYAEENVKLTELNNRQTKELERLKNEVEYLKRSREEDLGKNKLHLIALQEKCIASNASLNRKCEETKEKLLHYKESNKILRYRGKKLTAQLRTKRCEFKKLVRKFSDSWKIFFVKKGELEKQMAQRDTKLKQLEKELYEEKNQTCKLYCLLGKNYDTIVQYHQKLVTLENECQIWKNLGKQQNDRNDKFKLEREQGFVKRQVALLSNHKNVICSRAKGDGHFPFEEITDPRVEANSAQKINKEADQKLNTKCDQNISGNISDSFHSHSKHHAFAKEDEEKSESQMSTDICNKNVPGQGIEVFLIKNKQLENTNDEKTSSFAMDELVSHPHNVTSGNISQEETSFSGQTDIRFSEDEKDCFERDEKFSPTFDDEMIIICF